VALKLGVPQDFELFRIGVQVDSQHGCGSLQRLSVYFSAGLSLDRAMSDQCALKVLDVVRWVVLVDQPSLDGIPQLLDRKSVV